MSAIAPDEPDAPLDRVGELMERCLALPEAEQRAAVEEACAQHPELAAELRARVAFLTRLGIGPDAPPDGVPQRLGDFRLLDRIGGGGMGVVYRAEQSSLGRTVALKLVRPELLFFAGSRERFRREVEAIARLNHPGIVSVFVAGEESGVPYFAMELVEGSSLAEAIAALSSRAPESLTGADLLDVVRRRAESATDAPRPAPFERSHHSWADACIEVARQVAEALVHAHSQSLVHRDVKPSNVLLTVDGRARLVDFGLTSSAATDRITRTGSQVGTLHYMSPEQLRGGTLDARADVYSLGATLHELLTLRPPFDADDRVALERRILEGRPDPIRARNRKVSVDAETVCLQAMAPEPARRYATMREFADDLGRLLEGKPVRARPPRWPELAVRWARHHPGAALAASLVLLGAVGVPTGLYFLQRSHSKELQKHLDAESAALGREKDARRGEQEALKNEQAAHAAETMALEDMRRAFEMVTSVFKDATGAYTEGKQLTLREGLERLESRSLDGADAPRARAQVLNLLGQIRMLGAELDKARPLLERSEELLRNSGQSISRDRGMALQTLGRLQMQTGDPEAARKLYAEAIEVLRAVEPYDPNAVAQTIGYDAMSWSAAATLEKAIDRYGEAIETFVERPGDREDGEWLCEMHARRASLLGMTGRAGDANADLDSARAAIDWDAAPARLRMLVVNAEATIAMFAKDFDRADHAMEQTVAITRELFGPDHPNVATQLLKHAHVLLQKNEPDRAKQLVDEACRIVEAAFGAASPQSQSVHAQARQLLGTEGE